MYHYLQEVYWLNGMMKYIVGFVAKCPNCQQVKAEHQKLGGLSQDIDTPTWKWEDVNMDLVVGLPLTRRQHDSIWVIVDMMTKSAHFIPVKVSFSTEDYAKLYKSRKTDGQAECTIQTLEDMLKACVIYF
ncbi:hypothetical protein MTR67_022406, partial [Solanum verrucosum]